MFTKVRDASHIFRKRFGNFRGFILWLGFLREKACSPGTLFPVKVPGVRFPIYLRAYSSDIDAFCQIFCFGEVDVSVDHPVQYIIDAGANIGLASVFLANRYPAAQIDSLEIDADNLRVLRKNIAAYPNVQVVAKGLWSSCTTLKVLNPTAESWAFRVGETDESDPQGIPATTVQQLVSERSLDRVDILKMDIEGAEVEVLGVESGQWIQRVGTLLVELHDRFKPGCKDALERAINGRFRSQTQVGEYHVITF